MKVFKTAGNTWDTVSWKEMLVGEWIGMAKLKSVASIDIGRIGFDNPAVEILDLAGLTDSYIGKSKGGHLAKEFDHKYIFEMRKPEAIILRVREKPLIDKEGKLKKISVTTRLEAGILMNPAFAENYKLAVIFVHSGEAAGKFGKAIFIQKKIEINSNIIPPGKVVLVGKRRD